MILKPTSTAELSRMLVSASSNGTRIERFDSSELNRVLEHAPEDMTATVEAGLPLAGFQQHLRRAGQWLPVDPPHSQSLTIGDLLAYDCSGPRRFGYGTIRDYLIGIKVVLADGQLIKAGGKVVKNVAGYDLCKLLVGAKHSLGLVVEGTFKLRPLPERETILECPLDSLDELSAMVRRILESPLQPVILDAHNLNRGLALIAGFAGATEDVEYQLEIARSLGKFVPASTDYETTFWRESAQKISVLPSEMPRILAEIKPAEFVARAANGIIYYRGGSQPARAVPELPNRKLLDRVKNAYDPKHIFPACTT